MWTWCTSATSAYRSFDISSKIINLFYPKMQGCKSLFNSVGSLWKKVLSWYTWACNFNIWAVTEEGTRLDQHKSGGRSANTAIHDHEPSVSLAESTLSTSQEQTLLVALQFIGFAPLNYINSYRLQPCKMLNVLLRLLKALSSHWPPDDLNYSWCQRDTQNSFSLGKWWAFRKTIISDIYLSGFSFSVCLHVNICIFMDLIVVCKI